MTEIGSQSGDSLFNCDEPYWQRFDYAVIGLVADRSDVEQIIDAVRSDGLDVTRVRVLCGDEGVRILDRTGTGHGLLARFIRFVELAGYSQEILSLLEEGLYKGESIIAIPAAPNMCHHVGGRVAENNGHSVFYFGAGNGISLTGP